MESPLISVIIPAYNAQAFIGEAIASVLGQTLHDLEVIVVNDGSTDDTAAQVRSVGDARVRLIEKANGGVCSARNAGLEKARGAYMAFLDADDAMEPTAMQEKLDALRSTGADWVYGDLIRCDADLRPTGVVDAGTDKDVAETVLLGREVAVPTPCSNVLAHRRCFDGGIRLDTSMSTSADQDLAVQLARKYRGVHVHRALHRYRSVANSMSKSIALYEKDHLTLFAKADREGWFRDRAFRDRCYANMYYAFAGSWWKLGGDRRRALYYMAKALRMRPAVVLHPFRRFFGKAHGAGATAPTMGTA
jgi:glycosyltransferase involved in cell wall biosynthesis